MYTLDSTRGLRTTAHTVDHALTILGQHLHDMYRDGPIQWLIAGPDDVKSIGYLDITAKDPQDNADSIHQALQMCRDRLTAGATTTAD